MQLRKTKFKNIVKNIKNHKISLSKRKIIKIAGLIISYVLIIYLLLFLFWSVLIGSIILILLTFAAIAIITPKKINGKYFLKYRGYFSLALVLIWILTMRFSIGDVHSRFGVLSDEYVKNKTPGMSVKHKMEIYGLNIYMAIAAAFLYPNAAKETFLMNFPDEDKQRIFYSDFPFYSSKIRKSINPFLQALKKTSKKTDYYSKRIYWKQSDYNLGENEAEYGLALNNVKVEIKAEKVDGEWILDFETNTLVRYAPDSEAVLIDFTNNTFINSNFLLRFLYGGMKLSINEGLFRELEYEKWFFPYDVIYKFRKKLNSDDF